MFERLGNITNARELMEKMLVKRNDTQHEDPLFLKPGAIDPVVAGNVNLLSLSLSLSPLPSVYCSFAGESFSIINNFYFWIKYDLDRRTMYP